MTSLFTHMAAKTIRFGGLRACRRVQYEAHGTHGFFLSLRFLVYFLFRSCWCLANKSSVPKRLHKTTAQNHFRSVPASAGRREPSAWAFFGQTNRCCAVFGGRLFAVRGHLRLTRRPCLFVIRIIALTRTPVCSLFVLIQLSPLRERPVCSLVVLSPYANALFVRCSYFPPNRKPSAVVKVRVTTPCGR